MRILSLVGIIVFAENMSEKKFEPLFAGNELHNQQNKFVINSSTPIKNHDHVDAADCFEDDLNSTLSGEDIKNLMMNVEDIADEVSQLKHEFTAQNRQVRRKVEKLEMKLSNINDHDDDQDDDGEEVSESFVFNTKREGMITHIRLLFSPSKN